MTISQEGHLFLDHSWPWITESTESETPVNGGLPHSLEKMVIRRNTLKAIRRINLPNPDCAKLSWTKDLVSSTNEWYEDNKGRECSSNCECVCVCVCVCVGGGADRDILQNVEKYSWETWPGYWILLNVILCWACDEKVLFMLSNAL